MDNFVCVTLCFSIVLVVLHMYIYYIAYSASSAAESRKMRRARIAARNEARRMEMARKRSARGSGGK